MAGFGRRLVAIAIDWALCQLIALAVLGQAWGAGGAGSLLPLAVFAAENVLLVSTLGYTVGHRLLGLQVVRLGVDDPARPSAWLAWVPGVRAGLVRSLLLCLALPAMITGSDGRGWHDRLAGTMILRRPETR
jgi:uncharacterized RDD family membrane protein YckC